MGVKSMGTAGFHIDAEGPEEKGAMHSFTQGRDCLTFLRQDCSGGILAVYRMYRAFLECQRLPSLPHLLLLYEEMILKAR